MIIKFVSKMNLGNLSGKWGKGQKIAPFLYILDEYILYKYMLGQNIKKIIYLITLTPPVTQITILVVFKNHHFYSNKFLYN